MRISIPAVVFAVLLAVLAVNPAAAEVNVELREATPQITEQVLAPAVQMNLEMVQVPSMAERFAADQPAAATAQPTRTSWWWLVGAIVVAGVIIAVLVN